MLYINTTGNISDGARIYNMPTHHKCCFPLIHILLNLTPPYALVQWFPCRHWLALSKGFLSSIGSLISIGSLANSDSLIYVGFFINTGSLTIDGFLHTSARLYYMVFFVILTRFIRLFSFPSLTRSSALCLFANKAR